MSGVVGSRTSWAAPFALAAALVASPAMGAEAAAERSFSLAYAAPPGLCPDSERFLDAVRVRAPQAERRPNDADLAFNVALSEQGVLVGGVLAVRFRSGERFLREVPPAACDDVLTTMAIMAGLLLSGALLPELPPPELATVPTAGDATPGGVPPPLELPVPPPAPPVPERVAAPRAPSNRGSSVSPAPRVQGGLFVDGRLDFGAAPFPAFGVVGGLDARIDRGGWFSPGARLGFLYVADRADQQPLGSARFALVAASVRGCPLHVRLPASLALEACALFEGGRLTVAPRATPAAAGDARMPWLALGAAGRLEAPLAGRVSLEAELSGFGLLHHDAFVLEPGVVVHEVPVFSGALALGLVARWP